MEDNELIKRFVNGDKHCFDGLVLKYKDRIFNICLKMLGDYEEALDVCQDIFIKVYESLRNFRYEAKFSTYLYRICLNFCNNRLKALLRKKNKETFSINDVVETDNGTIKQQYKNNDPNPRETLEYKEKTELIIKALYSLKPEYKEILILKEIEEVKYEEIAQILNVDLGTVKSRLNRARQALKEKLEKIL